MSHYLNSNKMNTHATSRPYSPGTWYFGDRPCIDNYPQFLLRMQRYLGTPKLKYSFLRKK